MPQYRSSKWWSHTEADAGSGRGPGGKAQCVSDSDGDEEDRVNSEVNIGMLSLHPGSPAAQLSVDMIMCANRGSQRGKVDAGCQRSCWAGS